MSKEKPTRHDWPLFEEKYWGKFYSQCADSEWDTRDRQSIEESFQYWLLDYELIKWDETDYELE